VDVFFFRHPQSCKSSSSLNHTHSLSSSTLSSSISSTFSIHHQHPSTRTPVSNLLTRTYAAYCCSLSTLCLSDVFLTRHFCYCCFHHNRKLASSFYTTDVFSTPACSLFLSFHLLLPEDSSVDSWTFGFRRFSVEPRLQLRLLFCSVFFALSLFPSTLTLSATSSPSRSGSYWCFHSHPPSFSSHFTFRRV
jgi:hypothetical protein